MNFSRHVIETNCARDPDGPCGCGRALCGMESGKATTTMAVKELPLSEAAYRKTILESIVQSGFALENVNIDAVYDALTTVASFFAP
jgi:hypothetical protein